MEKIVKITNLVNYLKEIKYCHIKSKNISNEIKLKIYESYTQKSKTMSKNKFCIYLKPFGLVSSRIKEIIKIGEENNLPHRITKTKKIGLLAQHKKDNTLETYLATQHHIYAGYKALHKWQVDIKYLTDIPNYVKLGLFDIYLYEITFRDYKTGLTICYFGDDKSKSSVLIAFKLFENLMKNIGINLKDIEFQFDGGAEFSNIRINDVKGVLIEMIEQKYKGYKLINRKEQNGHVETFHR